VNLKKIRNLYVLSCIVLCLVFLSPTLAMLVPVPEGQKFSELWILGPTHMMEGYPFNILAGETYKVYLGVGNRIGHLGYYRVSVKVRTQSEPSPNTSSGAPSSLASLSEYNVFLRNDETWEHEFSFSFEGVLFEENTCRVSKVLIGDYAVDLNKVAIRNDTSNAFYYELFFELWIYDVAAQSFQFNNRWVGLWLNMSKPL
jgi:hypothetical protein